ncbi:hypothetical protein LRR18_18360, partial [Mangrovimonas sp. AS39]|uniref:hypothetical protein n=1 Tax=Mangrovimonas futianensis TaxID=2895523 RepID=UPI001E3E4734
KDYVSKVGPALRQLEQSLGGHIVMFGMGTSSLYRMIKLQMWAYEQGRDWEYILFKDHETVGGSKTLSTLGYDHCTDRDICVFIDDLIDRGRTFK